MKKINIMAIIISIFVLNTMAYNQSSLKLGGGLLMADLSIPVSGTAVTPDLDGFRFGVEVPFDDFLSGTFAYGSVDGTELGINFDVDVLVFALKGNFYKSENLNIYGILGHNSLDYSLSAPSVTTLSDDDSSLTYGLGASFNLSDSFEAQIEWQSYYDDQGIEADGIYFGLATQL